MLNLLAYSSLFVICPCCGNDGHLKSQTGTDIGGAYAHESYAQTGFIKAVCNNCSHSTPLQFATENGIQKSLKAWQRTTHETPRIKLPTDRPIIANLGMGVDSVAMLTEMVKQGIHIDYVMFANTGGEKQSTEDFKPYYNDWLISQGYPAITEVTYKPVSAPYTTLEGNCLSNETLPSLAFNRKSCSLKFKAAVMDDWLLGKGGANKCEGQPMILDSLAAGKKPVKLIGYDNGPADSRRAVKTLEDENFTYEHPLRQLKWDREDCVLSILAAGLRVPTKSACFFCPATKEWELYALAVNEPDKLIRAIKMEDTAREGKHGLTKINGLWGTKESWRAWGEREGIIQGDRIIMSDDELSSRFAALKPSYESNLIQKPSKQLAA